ncbi:unnamed protein product [Scytosiphon promiscuus]
MVVFYEARALFDYEPVASDELRLRVGDLIEVRIGGDGPQEEGWLFGSDQRGCHGSFPANYVAEVRGSVSADNADDPDDHGHESGDVHAALSYANQDGSAPTGRIGTPTALPKGEVNMNAQAGEGSQHDSAWVTRDPAQSTSASAVYDEGYRGTNNARCQPSHVATNAAIQESTQALDAIEGEGGVVASADRLPDGWLSAVDEASGTVYFYTEDGQSSWTRPSAVTVEPLPGVGGEHAPATAAGVGLALGSSSSQEEFGRLLFDGCEQDRGVKDSAATRIQAVARGKRSRRRMADRQARPKEDSLDGDTNDQLDHAQDVYEDDKAGIGSSLAHEGGLPLTALKGGGASSSGASATPSSPDTGAAAESEGRRRSVEVRIDRKAVELIASLVDERIMEEMHRRDSILSEIRESVAILTDRVVAGFPQKGNRRLSPSPSPKRAAREDNSQEDRRPQERKRNTAAPSLRTPNRSPERRSNYHGATASRARGHSPATNNGKGLNQPLSQQQHQRFEAPHQQHTPQRRHSPPAPVDHGSQHPAVPRDSPFRQRHFHRVEGGTGGAGGGGGDGVQEVLPPDRRSPSPPSPPSRSQPLRALVDCGGSPTAHQDRRPPGKDEPAEDIDDGDDDEEEKERQGRRDRCPRQARWRRRLTRAARRPAPRSPRPKSPPQSVLVQPEQRRQVGPRVRVGVGVRLRLCRRDAGGSWLWRRRQRWRGWRVWASRRPRRRRFCARGGRWREELGDKKHERRVASERRGGVSGLGRGDHTRLRDQPAAFFHWARRGKLFFSCGRDCTSLP